MIKRNQYPREMYIGGEVYTVRFVRKFKEKDVVGECDPTEHEIRILCGQGPIDTLKTFIHEVLHAIEMEHEIDVPHKLIYALEGPLFNFLRDNFIRTPGKRGVPSTR